jgi:FKBP-type peptidyl-prolyl cis-trans isomerase (trigger factor)
METAVMPEIELADYSKLSREAQSKIPEPVTEVEEKEIDNVIEDLRKRVGVEKVVHGDAEKKAEGSTENNTEIENGAKNATESPLPELDEAFIKKFGDFKDVSAFREKIKENIIEQKKFEVKDKRRAAIADKLIQEARFDVPEIIVDSELDTMIGQFRADVERSGYTLEGYLTHIKKTEQDIRKEWRENAVRRARLELILKHIGRTEKITLNEDEVKKEVDHIANHHKGADRFRIRMYVENLMTNQKVFEFLENQK